MKKGREDLELVKAGRDHRNLELKMAKAERDEAKADLADRLSEAESLGALKMIMHNSIQNELVKYGLIWKVKESGVYKVSGQTWDDFCKKIGESRRTVDEKLQDLRILYDGFSASFANLVNIPFNKIRYLGRSLKTELADSAKNTLLIDGDVIEITAENAEQIEAAIDAMKETHKRERDELELSIQSKDKVSKEKEKSINRLSKELSALKKKVQEVGISPDEEEWIDVLGKIYATALGCVGQLNPARFEHPPSKPVLGRYYAVLIELDVQLKGFLEEAMDRFMEILPQYDHTEWAPKAAEAAMGDYTGDEATTE